MFINMMIFGIIAWFIPKLIVGNDRHWSVLFIAIFVGFGSSFFILALMQFYYVKIAGGNYAAVLRTLGPACGWAQIIVLWSAILAFRKARQAGDFIKKPDITQEKFKLKKWVKKDLGPLWKDICDFWAKIPTYVQIVLVGAFLTYFWTEIGIVLAVVILAAFYGYLLWVVYDLFPMFPVGVPIVVLLIVSIFLYGVFFGAGDGKQGGGYDYGYEESYRGWP